MIIILVFFLFLVRLDAQNLILASQYLSLEPVFMQQRPIVSNNKLESGSRQKGF